MAKNIGRLFRWVVGKIGVGTMVGFGLLFVMFSSVVWWLNQFTGSLASPSLGRTTLIALLLGWLLARSRLSGWLAASLIGLAGCIVIVLYVGELVDPLLALARAGLAVLVLASLVWYRWRLARRGEAEVLTVIYTQLRRFGQRLGAPDFPGQTPTEVAEGVDFHIKRLEDGGRWKKAFAPAGDEIQRLVALYAETIYSPHAPESAKMNEARGIWRRVRWQLWLIMLASYARL